MMYRRRPSRSGRGGLLKTRKWSKRKAKPDRWSPLASCQITGPECKRRRVGLRKLRSCAGRCQVHWRRTTSLGQTRTWTTSSRNRKEWSRSRSAAACFVRFGALSTQDDQRALDAGGSQASRPASLEDAFEQENVAQSSKSRTAVKCVKASLAGFRVVVKELKDAWGQDPVKALCREYLRTSRKSRKAGFSVFSWRKR
jgi:hypothetical protein